ncbi:hypothetical protein K9B35_09425 [Sphingomonas sp. R647]|uniref:DUF3617 domain-containing protein n=1 Tax=Sphingomonas sp. R647 TaxID=2875233 RepID=UPI001CD44B0F|nr:hypothetical protein [Sphingomonas sp. R647]MCA1198186.1 hypothetical protein [Sphingomonas sp. R647]
MKMLRALATTVALLSPLAAGSAAMRADNGLTALGKIERGEWTLRAADGSSRSICVTDPQMLLQLHHRGAACTRFVVEDGSLGGRITYSCPGIGNGATRVVVETPRLIRLESQGISRGLPFSFEYEGRRTGPCR